MGLRDTAPEDAVCDSFATLALALTVAPEESYWRARGNPGTMWRWARAALQQRSEDPYVHRMACPCRPSVWQQAHKFSSTLILQYFVRRAVLRFNEKGHQPSLDARTWRECW